MKQKLGLRSVVRSQKLWILAVDIKVNTTGSAKLGIKEGRGSESEGGNRRADREGGSIGREEKREREKRRRKWRDREQGRTEKKEEECKEEERREEENGACALCPVTSSYAAHGPC